MLDFIGKFKTETSHKVLVKFTDKGVRAVDADTGDVACPHTTVADIAAWLQSLNYKWSVGSNGVWIRLTGE